MADKTDTIILKVEVQQGDAQVQAARLKQNLVELKQEQANLNKSFKEGKVTIDEYSSTSAKLDQSLKKTQSEYSNVTKSLTGTKTKMDDLIESNKNLADSIKVGGFSLGDLTSKFTSFLNPATATVAVMGGLAAAYARSTTGAKDLEFAQNELSTATTILTNKFANLFSSAADGQGFLSKQLTGFFNNITTFANAFGANSTFGKDVEHAAQVEQKLQDLQREETKILAANADRRADNAELQTKIADSQTSFNEKIQAANKITENAKKNQEDLLQIKQQELNIIKFQLSLDKDNEDLKGRVGDAELALSAARKQTQRDIKAAEVSKSNIIDANNKLIEQEKKLSAEAKYQTDLRKTLTGPEEITTLQTIEDQKLKIVTTSANKQFAIAKKLLDDKVKLNQKENNEENQKTKIAFLEQQNRLANISTTIGQAANLLDQDTIAYKALAISRAGIDTYRAADAALAEGGGVPFGLPEMFATIAIGLANVAKIAGLYYEGGFTGEGNKYEPAGVVHKGEYVIPQETVKVLGPTYFDKYLPGFADGGFVTNQATAQINSQMDLFNMLRMMPAPQVDVKEIISGINSVMVKNSLSSA